MQLILKAATAPLSNAPAPFITLLQHGSMKVELYKPKKADNQTPHLQDELYVIASGSGTFYSSDNRMHFSTGDMLFVKAGTGHCFENFTPDFATWVIFYGPDGGE